VKNDSGIVAGHGFTVGSPADSPNKTKFSKKLALVATAAVMCAALAVVQPVKADDLTVSGIQSALQGNTQALNSQQNEQPAGDDAVSALSSFAQQINTTTTKPDRKLDDQPFAALQDYAKRLGTTQQQSIGDLPQLAEADNLIDFLKQRSTPNTAPEKAKGPAATPKTERAPTGATFVDSKVCSTCHAPLIAEFEKTLMGRISKTQKGKFDCQNCHGPGSAHVKAGGGRGVGGILSFGKDDPRTSEEKNAVCLACHERGDRTLWQGSVHEERNLTCTNCHTVMKAVSAKHNLKTSFEADTCFQCHKDRRAQMYRSSHMPVREGKVTCSDCHNPHGSVTESLLKKDSINDTCYTCHAEKRGPFLFEHEPVRENCDNCHDPHGSINQYSLKMQRPRLCNECHSLMDSNAGRFNSHAIGQSCENCHVAIHGSNAPGGALFFR
jgi:DmsE family decaheme c-type cytochrome